MFRLVVSIALCLFASTQIHANDLTNGISTFGLDFYQQCIQQTKENVVISPFSVANSLALLAHGAAGNTFEVLRQRLQFDNYQPISNQFDEAYSLLQKGVGSSTFSVANKLYVQNGYSIKPKFKDIAIRAFRSDIENINFANNIDAAQTINQFVEQKTNYKIQNLISPDMLGYDSRLVLINAIYFKGNWQQPFDPKFTSTGDFYVSETEKVSTDYMHIQREFNYAFIQNLQSVALQLKYNNSALSLVIVLPNNRTGLSALETKLKGYDLKQITNQMELGEIDVWIPKFKIEFEVKMNEILEKLGLHELFSENSNLSGMFNTNERLRVTDAVHKAFIEVNEKGSEAAAATGMHVVNYSLPPTFYANHPFIYYIWDDSSKMPIFMGRVVNFNNAKLSIGNSAHQMDPIRGNNETEVPRTFWKTCLRILSFGLYDPYKTKN